MTTTVLASFPSPSQGVWYLGPVPVRAYALFIILGIVVALVIGDRRWEARGGERGVIYDIALWAVPFGLIGGRLYHVITDWPKYFGDDGAGLLGVVRIWDGGLGIWGAVALGGVGAWIACRHHGIPLPAFGDAIAPGIVLAQAIGRLGNYFNQELYGRPTDLPWALEIYERENSSGVVSPDLANGVSTGQVFATVHPTFLYELLWNVLVFAVLIWVDRRFKIGHGRLFALYVAGYCLGRFWIELLRSDNASLIADIRVNSFTSTFVFVGAVVYIMVAPKGREDPAALMGKPRDGSLIDEVADELVAVAATSGVVAAAKAAGDDEDDDAGAKADDLVDNELGAFEPYGDSEIDEETTAEAKLLAAAVAAESEGGDIEPESVGGVGAVEGEDAVAAPEAHEAALEGVGEAGEVAAEVAAEPEADDSAESDRPAEADDSVHDVIDSEGEAAESSEPDGGGGDETAEVAAEAAAQAEADESPAEAQERAEDIADDEAEAVGAVEGEDAVAAPEAAPEAQAAVEGVGEAGEVVAAEVAAEPEADDSAEGVTESDAEATEESEIEQPGEDDAEAEVEIEAEFDEVAPDAEESEDDAESETDEADAMGDDIAEAEPEKAAAGQALGDQPTAGEAAAQTDQRGGRLRRLFRRNG